MEKLSQASNCPEVHIYADENSRLGEIEKVRDLYFPEAFIFHAKPHIQAPSGCWNILNAINHAGQYADEVYLVEEDVLVYPYFFDWHATQTAPVSCGRQHIYGNPPQIYPYYTNPGTCFRRPLLDALRPHVRDAYFRDTNSYCEAEFGELRFISTLDDGLIRRVIAKNKFEFVFPPSPVCAHVGMRWLGRLDIYQIVGETLEERIECVRGIIAAPKNQARYAGDWEPFSPSSHFMHKP